VVDECLAAVDGLCNCRKGLGAREFEHLLSIFQGCENPEEPFEALGVASVAGVLGTEKSLELDSELRTEGVERVDDIVRFEPLQQDARKPSST